MGTAKTLNGTQTRALAILERSPDQWHAPGAYSLPWQSFEALVNRGLADKQPETRANPVRYRLRSNEQKGNRA